MKGPGKDNFIKAGEEKYILSLRGICRPFTMPYYRDINEEEKEIIRKALQEYNMPLDGLPEEALSGAPRSS